ncbi:MAG TPA: hypothetical protein VM146_19620 [Steroidobacteraceae bacterium]|nr:hypothetical protein [Steroidobacteraceae bacterium]
MPEHIEETDGDDAEDTALLNEMARDARAYIEAFDWCPPIEEVSLGYGVGGVLALFQFEFAHAIEGTDDSELWVVVGDIPSAYFIYEGNEDKAVALECYCALMEEWALAARDGEPVDECFPVEAEPTSENAEALLSRVAFIRNELRPEANL